MTNQLDEVDRLTLLLNHTRVSEAETKIRELALLTEKAQMDLLRAQSVQLSGNKKLLVKYSLLPTDQINSETGEITRTEVPSGASSQDPSVPSH